MTDRESPDNTDVALEIRMWLRMLTCTTMIERNLRSQLKANFDTSMPRFDALAQLYREPDGMTMGQLSKHMMVTNGNVTWLIDRLVDDGLAERVPAPADRRAHIVRLTEKGTEQFEKMMPDHHSWIHTLLADMDSDDLEALQGLLSTLKESVAAGEDILAKGLRKQT